jgi:hypothetical protein
MSGIRDGSRQRLPTASQAEVAAEVAAFPVTTIDLPIESFFPDWRRRLTRNLATRSDGRWEPLTWVHARANFTIPTPARPFADLRDTRLWYAIEASIEELVATREISVNTANDYVVGNLCRELLARKLIAGEESPS